MTDSLFTYSLSCGIILAVLYGLYFLTTKHTTLFGFNRRMLLTIMAFSMAAPLLTLNGGVNSAVKLTGLTLPEFEVTLTVANLPDTGTSSPIDILATIYLWGLVATALWTIANLAFISYICLTSHTAKIGNSVVRIHTRSGLSPFSWGGMIFIPKEMLDDNDRDIAITLAHESSHCRRRHWLDLLAANAVVIINWYNPCAWLMLRELIGVHEFEADRDTLSMCDDPAEYQLLLIKKTAGSRFHAFADSLNHSSLKKRITMMMKNQTKSRARLRALAMLPVMAAALCVSNVSCASSADDKNAETEVSAETANTAEEVIGTVEIPEDLPEFEGGMEKLYVLIAENIRYPEDAIKDGIEGKVVVRITVGIDGEIKDPEAIKSVCPSLDKEAVRTILKIKENGGRFTPATDEAGNPVETTYALPISFKLK